MPPICSTPARLLWITLDGKSRCESYVPRRSYRATGGIVSQASLERSLHAYGEMSGWATLRETPTTNCTCDDQTFAAFTLRRCGPDDRTTGFFAEPPRAAGSGFG